MIDTDRLTLRAWRDADLAPFAAMSRDVEVMAHLGGPQSDDAVAAAMARARASQVRDGFCFWAVERREDRAFIGFCGIKRLDLPGTPVDGAIEIGWRLARAAWGKGYAGEAARAALDWSWANPAPSRIVAITVPANRRSLALMQRIGMTRRPALDFDHPAFMVGHELCRHVTCTIDRTD